MLKAGETAFFFFSKTKMKISSKVKKRKKKCYQKGIRLDNTPDGCAAIQRDIKKLDSRPARTP